MRKGGGKAKGSHFERLICKLLSMWVTNGEHGDVFWRSAMSGGRATVARKRGYNVRQGGDLCSVAPEGNDFIEFWYVECKAIRDAKLGQFILFDDGILSTFWATAKREARKYGRHPMLIVKQNGWPAFVILPTNVLGMWVHIADCIHNPGRGWAIVKLRSLLKRKYNV